VGDLVQRTNDLQVPLRPGQPFVVVDTDPSVVELGVGRHRTSRSPRRTQTAAAQVLPNSRRAIDLLRQERDVRSTPSISRVGFAAGLSGSSSSDVEVCGSVPRQFWLRSIGAESCPGGPPGRSARSAICRTSDAAWGF
jgi:hypothetical protein